jgi:hypothetical protein
VWQLGEWGWGWGVAITENLPSRREHCRWISATPPPSPGSGGVAGEVSGNVKVVMT